MAGIVDWDAIEDRIRKPKIPYWVHDPKDAISDMLKQYRLDRMKGQENRIEVWVEKDALPPQVLIDLCTTEIEKRIDLDLWEDQVAREEVDILEIKNRFNI